LAEIRPENISVTVEEKVSKFVKIIPVLALSYKPGYGLVSTIKNVPDSVEISGPKSIVNDIMFINTKGFGITNLEKGDVVKLQLEDIKFVQLATRECEVSFEIQKIVDKTFLDLVVKTNNIPSRYELILSPNKINLTLRGGLNLLSKMKNNDISSSVSNSISGYFLSSKISLIFSEILTPPGSLINFTVRPSFSKSCRNNSTCVDFPQKSNPSNVINILVLFNYILQSFRFNFNNGCEFGDIYLRYN